MSSKPFIVGCLLILAGTTPPTTAQPADCNANGIDDICDVGPCNCGAGENLPDAILAIEIFTDIFPAETTWELVEQTVGIIASGGPLDQPNTLFTQDVPICNASCYNFTIFDAFGDGICCALGNGFYNLVLDGVVIATGGAFTNAETVSNIGDCLIGASLDCNANGSPDDCDLADGTSPDCNGNGIPDSCDIASGADTDCNGNGIPDECDLADGVSTDCNTNGIPDECDIGSGNSPDCNTNSIPDECDITDGTSFDNLPVAGDGIPDECQLDCNGNLIPDADDLADGTSPDCNANGIPDECESQEDCNGNGIQDLCDLAGGFSHDCQLNGIPDECDIVSGFSLDCQSNGIPDECDALFMGAALDFDGADDWVRIPRAASLEPADELTIEVWIRPDSAGGFHSRIVRNAGHFAPGYILAWSQSGDHHLQLRIDGAAGGNARATDPLPASTYFGQWIHAAGVYSAEQNLCLLYVNGILVDSQPAVGMMQYSGDDLFLGNFNAASNEDFDGLIDEVRIWSIARTQQQIINNMDRIVPGSQVGLVGYWRFNEGQGQAALDSSPQGNHGTLGDNNDPAGDGRDPIWVMPGAPIIEGDCNNNDIPDECEIADGTSLDNLPVGGDGIPDECQQDCNGNQILDEVDLADGTSQDCNANDIPDECELAGNDCNTNDIPDDCEPDCDADGTPDVCEIAACPPDDLSCADCNLNGIPDGCESNAVDAALDFDGIDDFVALPHNFLPWTTSATTVEVWFQTADSGVIFGQQAGVPFPSPGGWVPILYVGLDGKLRAEYWWGSGSPLVSADPVNDNQWHHVAISYDLQTFRLYLDGFEIGQKVTSLSNYSNSLDYQLGIGFTHNWPSAAGSWWSFQGRLDEFRAWNVARSQSDIENDMNRTLVGDEVGLIAYLQLDEAAGQFATDSSGSGNDGVLGSDADPAGDASDPIWQSPGVPIVSLDCNGNGIPDDCDIADGVSLDCNANAIPDECEPGGDVDCNANGISNLCDLFAGTSQDCNEDIIPDDCQLIGNDCDANGVPDECDPDCNTNGIPDACDIADGTSQDCQPNGIPDECDTHNAGPGCSAIVGYYDIAFGIGRINQEAPILAAGHNPVALEDLTAADLVGIDVLFVQNRSNSRYGGEYLIRLNEISDAVIAGMVLIIHDRYVDTAEAILPGWGGFNIMRNFSDPTINVLDNTTLVTNGPGGVVDDTTLAGSHGFAVDASLPPGATLILTRGSPNEIVTFSYRYGVGAVIYSSIPLDFYLDGSNNFSTIYAPNVVAYGASLSSTCNRDCNGNSVPDECDMADGTSLDDLPAGGDGIPDECQSDCNENLIPDADDFADGTSRDCNANGIPDECDIAAGTSPDCNGNGIPDVCDIFFSPRPDCNDNGIPDDCDIADGTSQDCDANGVPDNCDITQFPQLAKLTAPDANTDNWLGHSISISGETVVIGSPLDDHGINDSGSVYVFVRTAGVWTQQAKLIAEDAASGDVFGASVSIDGDTAVIGANLDNDAGNDSGSAYVFVRTAGVWTQQAKLTADDAAFKDLFGVSVSISGDTAVIGAFWDDDACPEAPLCDSGSAYVFVRSDGVWTQQAKLTAADAADSDQFGLSVSISGDTAVIGALLKDDAGSNSGSAYVFVRSGTVWTQQAKLTAADAAASDQFGNSVSISNDTTIIGAWRDDDYTGSAYVFVRTAGVWTQQAKLTAADAFHGDIFGLAVSINDHTAIIGAPWDDDAGTGSGSAYVFARTAGVWTQRAKLNADDAAPIDEFGSSVSISGNSAAIGARFDDNADPNSGSAYMFITASFDCQADGIPDDCQLDGNDCNANGIPDECDGFIDTTPPVINCEIAPTPEDDSEDNEDNGDENAFDSPPNDQIDTIIQTGFGLINPTGGHRDGIPISDEGIDGPIMILFDASDDCSPVTLSAIIDIGCEQIPIENGTLIDFECEDGDDCEAEEEDGILEIEAASAIITVTATDETGNTSTCEIILCSPPIDGGDNGGSDDSGDDGSAESDDNEAVPGPLNARPTKNRPRLTGDQPTQAARQQPSP